MKSNNVGGENMCIQYENRTKDTHLGFIQSVVTRMGQNSLQTKSWCITLTVALITFYTARDIKPENVRFFIVLWTVDTLFLIIYACYFLLEKRYRCLYDVVAGLESDGGVMVANYSLKIPDELKERKTWWRAILTRSVLRFYGVLFIYQCGILATLNCG